MKIKLLKNINNILFILFFLFLVLHIIITPHYSINWDFHHVFFAGINNLGHKITDVMVKDLLFIEPDPRRMIYTPFGPLQTTLPALSYIVFYEYFKLLPFDASFNLPTVIFGSFGVIVLYFLLKSAINFRTGIFAAILLALYPRYFGDMHTNVKDIPTAVLFTVSIYYLFKIINYQKYKDILLGSFFWALTFNFKVNALLVPPIGLIYVLFIIFTPLRKLLPIPIRLIDKKFSLNIIKYALFSLGFAFIIWSIFWQNPIDQLKYMINFFVDNTQNIEVLLWGKWYCSTVNTPWYYPFVYLFAVSPVFIIIFFFIGIFVCIKNIFRNPIYILLLIWFLVPLSKYISPKIGVIDGIRHFEEVVFPLIAISAVGLNFIFEYTNKRLIHYKLGKYVPILFVAIFICYMVYEIISTHPYQLTYFNEIVGGRSGAMGKFDLDYWGISQKEAVNWLNKNAKENAKIYIVMSPDTAGKYLREDLKKNLNKYSYDNSDYVVVLNRQSFFYRYLYIWEYFLRRKPGYIVEVKGIPLTWVFDNSLGSTARKDEWWSGEGRCVIKYWDTPIPKGVGTWKF